MTLLTGDITQLLMQWSNGDEAALDKLTPLVYADGMNEELDWDLVAVNEALKKMEKKYPRHYQVAVLKFFGGLKTGYSSRDL